MDKGPSKKDSLIQCPNCDENNKFETSTLSSLKCSQCGYSIGNVYFNKTKKKGTSK